LCLSLLAHLHLLTALVVLPFVIWCKRWTVGWLDVVKAEGNYLMFQEAVAQILEKDVAKDRIKVLSLPANDYDGSVSGEELIDENKVAPVVPADVAGEVEMQLNANENRETVEAVA